MEAARDFRESIELVLFEVAGQRFAAATAEVLHIGRCQPDASPSRLLGAPLRGRRGLEVRGGRMLPIDRVLGVRHARIGALRRLPAFARDFVSPAAAGLLLDGKELLLLIDLEALVEEEPDLGLRTSQSDNRATARAPG